MLNRCVATRSLLAFGVSLALHAAVWPLAFSQHPYPAASEKDHAAVLASVSLPAVKSGFEAFDSAALGQRMPLVLIHGIGGDESRLFHWENFLSVAEKNQNFQAKYKIYLYHYDSRRSVPDISQDLQTTLKGFIGALNNRKIKILAYSEGGLLTRNALQDPYLNDHTEEIIAIATPFHGSPLANPEWLGKQVKTESAFSLVRMGEKIAYKITGHKYPTFRQDFHWDNFDGAIPAADYEKANGPQTHTRYALASKQNFVTYGSYFGVGLDCAYLSKTLELTAPIPEDRPMPRNLLHSNFLFSLIRNNIGKLPLANKLTAPRDKDTTADALTPAILAGAAAPVDAPPNAALIPTHPLKASTGALTLPGTPLSMMMFNDGISPISSTLWLGRFTQGGGGSSVPVDRLWAALKSLKGGKHARLFAGLDHRNWMDGNTRTGEEVMQDLLNPDEKPRTVFEWILYDLMS